ADSYLGILEGARSDIAAMSGLAKEGNLKESLEKLLSDQCCQADGATVVDIDGAISRIRKGLPAEPAPTSSLVPRIDRLCEKLLVERNKLKTPAPEDLQNIQDLIAENLPKFVYYSNYGNLDSEIYLPHVVQNLKRDDLGAREAAKARTLRVLFNFVTLQPKEILELGQDFPMAEGRTPTQEEIAEIATKKRDRTILLNSAATMLTKRFGEWWKQGDYIFEFQADGDHFRIWVSDAKRPEKVELEDRSTGLQWFLSFYLVFLVESRGEHRNAILLLDEPGLSLHPLAQRDLSLFFENLAQTNQLIYTTHSPFLVDADSLDRARKVYVGPDGSTKGLRRPSSWKR
ncbi:ATP-binding protein, partial [Altererythrobacter sp. KTW20L]|uniref:ATP-dependent nuclease n=1 Tax=Altererythrobacter sp. KTW20L TaxID=2942210 RepID=UPI0020BF02D0